MPATCRPARTTRRNAGVLVVVALLASGCRQVLGLDDPLPGDPGQTCLGEGAWEVCVLPSGPVTLPPEIHTGDASLLPSPLCASSEEAARWATTGAQPDACFIVATIVTIDTAVRFTGTRPVVLAGTDAIVVTAAIDIASHRGAMAAAGTRASCSTATQPEERSGGAGGGAGGSFATIGGAGGTGDEGAARGGSAVAPASPAGLQGGCSGQDGGIGSSGGAGNGGAGGGALYLVADRISIASAASINASGASGGGGGPTSGGGGGGSGGMVVLHATTFTGSRGVVIANGGGGAAGATSSSDGGAGTEPLPSSPLQPAPGGTTSAGTGGGGYAGTTPAESGAAAPNGIGGGGGGGGAGVIYANERVDELVASPAIAILPAT